MKIKHILNEDVTDVVARLYIEASADSERFYNPENAKYKELNSKYYEKHFKPWFEENVTPVFEKPVHRAQPKYDNHPRKDSLQSPGYRGLQYSLAAAGLPYDHRVQRYENITSRALAAQTMVGLGNLRS
jgi:hypothetical protein